MKGGTFYYQCKCYSSLVVFHSFASTVFKVVKHQNKVNQEIIMIARV